MTKIDYFSEIFTWILICFCGSVLCKTRTLRLLVDDIRLCPPGNYCPNDTSVGLLCPIGHYCPSGTSAPIPCPAGTYSSLAGQTTCVICPAWYMCPVGTSSPVICAAGTYNNLSGQSNCVDCPSGFYCQLSRNGTDIHICPSGMYCPQGSTMPTICPAGTFNRYTGQTSCSKCPAGLFCSAGSLQGIPCQAGTFLDQNYCRRCPEGHYCPTSSVRPIACPPGTYQTQTGGTSVSDCTACPCGLYCYPTGLSQPTGICDSGYYCIGGANSPKPTDGVTGNKCSVDYSCPEGSCRQM